MATKNDDLNLSNIDCMTCLTNVACGLEVEDDERVRWNGVTHAAVWERSPGARVIDCMACLVTLAQGLPEGDVHCDDSGVTHSTLRSMDRAALTCTVRRYSGELWSTALTRWVPK